METTYTVDESVGAVNVCVSLTHPMRDILDNTVRVSVFDYSNSIYIPRGASLASEFIHIYSDHINIFCSHHQLLMNLPFSVSTPWQRELTLLKR